jgi:crotonobetainyl-CoA:carnitine CoA-transferase CaiB-like acyl-CoA transferase
LISLLTEELLKKDRAEWIEELTKVGITAGPINTFDKTLEDRQAVAREVIWNVEHPTIGNLPLIANALQYMSRTPAAPQGPPPLLGEHTREVLAEFLSTKELDEYQAGGVIGSTS